MKKMKQGLKDDKLVLSAKRGDKAAFELLVERHFGLVYSIAYARIADPKAAEDIAQEVFLRSFLHIDSLSDPGKFTSWLAQITRNLSVDWLRKGIRRSALISQIPLEEAMPDHKAKGVTDAMEKREEFEAIRKAIFQLPEYQREIVMLHFFEKLTKPQIAQRLCVHRSTIGRQLKTALKAMKGLLAPMLYDASPAFKAKPVTIARTVAIIGAASAMSTTAKAALAAAAGGKALVTGISFGAANAAATTSGLGLLKSTATTLITGAKIMTIGKGTTIAVAAVILTLAGANFYRQMPKKTVKRTKSIKSSIGEEKAINAQQECFPKEVCEYLITTLEEAKLDIDPTGKFITNMLARSVNKNLDLWPEPENCKLINKISIT